MEKKTLNEIISEGVAYVKNAAPVVIKLTSPVAGYCFKTEGLKKFYDGLKEKDPKKMGLGTIFYLTGEGINYANTKKWFDDKSE